MEKGKRMKLLSALFSVVLVIMLAPMAVYAADGWNNVYTIEGLNEALASGDNVNIRLTDHIMGSYISISSGEVVIDLNGYSLNRNITAGVTRGNVIDVSGSAKLTVMDSSAYQKGEITGGWNTGSGGGVRVTDKAVFTLESGKISNNISKGAVPAGGGVYVGGGAKFIMNGGQIDSCSAGNNDSSTNGRGGGVYVARKGQFEMNGGRIYACGLSQYAMDTSRYSTTERGGAVYVAPDAGFVMTGGEIGIDTVGNEAFYMGGAVYVAPADEPNAPGDTGGEFMFKGGTITGGKLPGGRVGAGVYNGGTFTMEDGTAIINSLGGDSVYTKGTFTMKGGTISNVNGTGGMSGVTVNENGTFDMAGGKITSNFSPYGAGVLIEDGTFNMKDGEISGNTADFAGGGVYITGSDGTFNMSGGVITDNSILNASPSAGNGGGVWVGDQGTFNMSGGSITKNKSALTTAGTGSVDHAALGGGVFVSNEGSFQVSGAVIIQDNTVGESYVSNVKVSSLSDNKIKVGEAGLDGAKIGVTPDLVNGGSSAENTEAFKYKDGADYNIFTAGYDAAHSGESPDKFFTSDIDGYAVVLHSSMEAQLIKHEHSWKFEGFTWTGSDTEGYTAATANYVCIDFPDHKTTASAEVKSNTVQPSCTEPGKTTYTASISAEASPDGTEHTDTKEAGSTPAHGHAWGEWTNLDNAQHQRVCAHDASHIEKQDHAWDNGVVTKEATVSSEGEKTYTCSICKATKVQKIPKLEPAEDEEQVDKKAKKNKGEGDIKGSKFGLLRARGVAAGTKKITLKWHKIPKAKKYVVYGNRCNSGKKKYVMKKLLKTKKLKYKPKKILKKKLKKGTYYKFFVVALDKNNKVLAISKTIHVTTDGGKKGNDKKVKLLNPKTGKVTLKKGKTLKIKAKEIRGKKKVSRHRKIRFESDNPTVVKVNGKGVITAKKKGTAKVYAYAQNGVFKTVTVKVK